MRLLGFILLAIAPVAAFFSPTRPGLALLAAALIVGAWGLLACADHKTQIQLAEALDELEAANERL